jgi:hypothetical protein
LTSDSNHSPGSPAVSSGGFPAAKTAGELDPLSVLIDQSDRAVERLLADLDEPRYQAALSDLAAQSARAADALYGLEQTADGLRPSGETP